MYILSTFHKQKSIIILDYLMVLDAETFHNNLLSKIAPAANAKIHVYHKICQFKKNIIIINVFERLHIL